MSAWAGPPSSFLGLLPAAREVRAPLIWWTRLGGDNAILLAEAERLEKEQFAAPFLFANSVEVDLDLWNSGTWETLADASLLWRLRISSPNALHLNLGLSHFDLPAGAGFWIYDPAGGQVEGPYTLHHRSPQGRLFTPVVLGDEVILELHVPAEASGRLELRVGWVNHGFRGFGAGGAVEKSHGACNNDVICPEADSWRDQIRSVARYTIFGSTLCSGQLVNNTSEDGIPLGARTPGRATTTTSVDSAVRRPQMSSSR